MKIFSRKHGWTIAAIGASILGLTLLVSHFLPGGPLGTLQLLSLFIHSEGEVQSMKTSQTTSKIEHVMESSIIKERKNMDIYAVIAIFLLLAGWFTLSRWVLPWLGVPTCMSGSCSLTPRPTEHLRENPRPQGDEFRSIDNPRSETGVSEREQ